MITLSKFKSLCDSHKMALLAITATVIFVLCIVTAQDTVEESQPGTAGQMAFWLINLPFMGICAVVPVLVWRNTIRNKKHYLFAAAITLAAVVGVIFILSLRYPEIFPAIKAFLTNLF